MCDPGELPWYRRPLLPNFPSWILFCLATAGAFAYLGHHVTSVRGESGSGFRGAFVGVGIGFCFGVFLLVRMQTSQMRRQAKGARPLPPYAMPPVWVSAPVSIAVIDFIAVENRNPLLAIAFLSASAIASIRLVAHEPRRWSVFYSGILCLLLTTAACILVVLSWLKDS